MKKDLFGAHLSVAGGLHTVFKRTAEVGAHVVQIFTKSNQSYFAKPIPSEEAFAFVEAWKQSDVSIVVTHAAYLINLAASNSEVEKKSINSLQHELERCVQLKIPYLVLHPGAHTGRGVESGIAQIACNLSEALHKVPGDTVVLLETAAGQGTTLGRTFQELRAMYDACDEKIRHRVAICLDTCHVFAAGYNLDSVAAYHAMMKEFDAIIGRTLLKVVHLNDSLFEVGCGKDRHANLKQGKIPFEVLHACAHDMNERGIAVILETPSEDGVTEYTQELMLLRGDGK
ncbi:MAG: deoxyribonuclease [Candidatus Dependentiae bacterium]|nr:deoxyribonuclease [Candidatus Dependentiae bacterium]